MYNEKMIEQGRDRGVYLCVCVCVCVCVCARARSTCVEGLWVRFLFGKKKNSSATESVNTTDKVFLKSLQTRGRGFLRSHSHQVLWQVNRTETPVLILYKQLPPSWKSTKYYYYISG